MCGYFFYLLAAGLASYRNSFAGPFLFDSIPCIVDNPMIRTLWPGWTQLLAPPTPPAGRPFLLLSLSLNYALGGLDVVGYHAVNFAIHFAAALTLYGLVRRTLALRVRDPRAEVGNPRAEGRGPRTENAVISDLPGPTIARAGAGRPPTSPARPLPEPGRADLRFQTSDSMALAIALLWLVHPLQTQAVTYIIQRSESLMGLCYLLTLYCVLRSASAASPLRWQAAAVASCAVGMGVKPVMATAPLLALLFDRAFLAGSWRDAMRHRWRLYLALASTWILLAACVASGARASPETVGFSMPRVRALDYLLTQPGVILHYVKLAVWPHPLVFDYGWPVTPSTASLVPLLGIAVAGGVIVWTWRRSPAAGFLGAAWFLLLAPSSSIVPLADAAVEYRLYLPLACVLTALVLGVDALLARGISSPRTRRLMERSLLIIGVAALALTTVSRNEDYLSEERIWRDTMAKRPLNWRAYNNLGMVLIKAGRPEEAMTHLAEALRLNPRQAETYNNFGNALIARGRTDEGMRYYVEALAINPRLAEAYTNLGNALVIAGKLSEAESLYATALRIAPSAAAPRINLGIIAERRGKPEEALARYEDAVRLEPNSIEARLHAANWLTTQHRLPEAIAHYAAALRLRPDHADAHNNLAAALAQQGRVAEAERHYREAIRLRPGYAEAHNNFGVLLSQAGKADEAIRQYREALRLNPDYDSARHNLDLLLSESGRTASAQAAASSRR